MIFQNEKHIVRQTHVICVSFILNAQGHPYTESPQARLIGVIKQMTLQELPYMDKGIQLLL